MSKIYKNKFKKLPAWLFQLYSKQLLRSYDNYHPIINKDKIITNGDRNCQDRWQIISQEIKNYHVSSLIDLGCAEGYYVLQAAKNYACLSLGVDADIRRLSMAHNQIISEQINGAGFLYALIDQKLITQLPSFDMIIFMSVMHHLMYQYGQRYCQNFLSQLKNKINKVMIFEMGQSDETKNDWANRLPDMGNDPHGWIKEFLLSAGFSKVEKIGTTDSYQKDQTRAIFKAEL